MRRYAEGTKVQVESSQAEAQQLLKRYGATRQAVLHDYDTTYLRFEVRDIWYQLEVHVPPVDSFRRDDYGVIRSTEKQIAMREQEERRRWRVLILLLKAKLEVATEAEQQYNTSDAEDKPFTDFEHEFLAYRMLPDDTTVGDTVIPFVDRINSGDVTIASLTHNLLPKPDGGVE